MITPLEVLTWLGVVIVVLIVIWVAVVVTSITYQNLRKPQKPSLKTWVIATKPKTFEEAVWTTLEVVGTTVIKKNRDYGKENISHHGEYGVAVRANDKLQRITNLLFFEHQPEVEEENIEDTWIDITGYGLIGTMIRAGVWGLPFEEKPPENQHG